MVTVRRNQSHTDVARLLSLVERAVVARLGMVLDPAGSSVEQWRVLCLLSDGSGHPMSEIARYAALPAPTLTKVVDRLVAANLVYRRVDVTDRRRVLVHISARGRTHFRRLEAGVESEWERLTGHLGDDQLGHLADLLTRIAAELPAG